MNNSKETWTTAQPNTFCQKIRKSSLADLRNDLITAAMRYARIRTDWQSYSDEDKANKSRARSSAHDAFIDACNILSRQMAKAGEENSWRNELVDRQNIGDFACYVYGILGIETS